MRTDKLIQEQVQAALLPIANNHAGKLDAILAVYVWGEEMSPDLDKGILILPDGVVHDLPLYARVQRAMLTYLSQYAGSLISVIARGLRNTWEATETETPKEGQNAGKEEGVGNRPGGTRRKNTQPKGAKKKGKNPA